MPELNLVLLGPPGAGKGTQAERLIEDFKLPYMATGNVLRDAVEQKTELGLEAKGYMDRGDLAPDGLVNAIVTERLTQPDTAAGFILDGFPRNEVQADVLDAQLEKLGRKLSAVLMIDVPEEDLIKRLSGRRQCVKNQHVFNVFFDPPKHEDHCDLDGSRLEIRDDDKPDVVKRRLETYREQTEPLIEHYEKQGILKRIDGARPTNDVSDEIRAKLAALKFEETV